MIALTVAVAALTLVLLVLLRRPPRLPRGYGDLGFLDGLGLTVVPSRYVRPGDMLIIDRRVLAGVRIDVGPITPVDEETERMRAHHARQIRLEAEIGMRVVDPAAFVRTMRITGV